MPLQDLLDAVQVGHPEHGYRCLVSPQFHEVFRENLPNINTRKLLWLAMKHVIECVRLCQKVSRRVNAQHSKSRGYSSAFLPPPLEIKRVRTIAKHGGSCKVSLTEETTCTAGLHKLHSMHLL